MSAQRPRSAPRAAAPFPKTAAPFSEFSVAPRTASDFGFERPFHRTASDFGEFSKTSAGFGEERSPYRAVVGFNPSSRLGPLYDPTAPSYAGGSVSRTYDPAYPSFTGGSGLRSYGARTPYDDGGSSFAPRAATVYHPTASDFDGRFVSTACAADYGRFGSAPQTATLCGFDVPPFGEFKPGDGFASYGKSAAGAAAAFGAAGALTSLAGDGIRSWIHPARRGF